MTTQYKIYCGRNIAGGASVSDAEINGFIHEVIVPLFDGFSVSNVQGYWRGQSEDTVVFEIISDTYLAPVKIQTIAEKYKLRFDQESVLVTSTDVNKKFV
jgi:Protein of unknown function (DUF3574)